MKAIDEIRNDVEYVEILLENIKRYGFMDKDFTASELGEYYSAASRNTQLMPALVRRGLAEVVGTVEWTFKKEILFNGKFVEATIPYEANVYRIVHNADWYREVLIMAVINACR